MAPSDCDVATTATQIAVMASNHGLDPSEVWLGLCVAAPVPLSAGGSLACWAPLGRGTYVEAVVTMDAPSFDMLGVGVTVCGFAISTAQSSLVDLYRSVEP